MFTLTALTYLTVAISSIARVEFGSSETPDQQDITKGRVTLAAHATASGA